MPAATSNTPVHLKLDRGGGVESGRRVKTVTPWSIEQLYRDGDAYQRASRRRGRYSPVVSSTRANACVMDAASSAVTWAPNRLWMSSRCVAAALRKTICPSSVMTA